MDCFLNLISPQVHQVGSVIARNWIGPRRTIYDQELLLIESGICETAVAGQVIRQKAPSFIIKPSGIPHSAKQLSPGKIVFRYAHFDWIYIDPPLPSFAPIGCYEPAKPKPDSVRPAPDFIPREILHGPIPFPDVTFDRFTRLNDCWNLGTAQERACSRLILTEILFGLLGERFHLFDKRPHDAGAQQLAERIREVLNRMLQAPREARKPLEQEIVKLGYTYPHLCRIFKKRYGISPLTYFNNVRMERAQALLSDTSLPICEVALHVGIASPNYFSRIFSKYRGQSPKSYRDSL